MKTGLCGFASASVLLAACGSAGAFGFFDNLASGCGTVLPSPTAWGLAHGGLGALPASGAAGLFANPADLPADDALSVDASISGVTWGTTTWYQGFLTPNRINSGLAAGPAVLAACLGGRSLSYGLGIARVSDFSCRSNIDVQDTTETGVLFVEGIERIESSGELWEALAGGALDPFEGIRLGASAGLRFGRGEVLWSRYDSGEPDPEETDEAEWEEASFCCRLGIHARTGDLLFAGSAASSSDRYPFVASFGLQAFLGIMGNAVAGVETGFTSFEGRRTSNAKAFLEVGGMFSPSGRTVFSIGMLEPEGSARSGLCSAIGQRIVLGESAIDLGYTWSSSVLEGTGLPVPFIIEDESSAHYLSLGFSSLL